MRHFSVTIKLISALIVVASLNPLARAATVPLYVNSDAVVVPPGIAPRIDATTFVNDQVFNINIFTVPLLPYETLNTRYFTNTQNGFISGFPGFRYDYFSGNTRRWMHSWVNEGEASGEQWYLVYATNITSAGNVGTGIGGVVRLHGNNINLTRAGIRAGLAPGTFLFDGFTDGTRTNYFNPDGVTDIYWGVGSNNTLNSQGPAMRLDNVLAGSRPFFDVPCASSSAHQVTGPAGGTNSVSLPASGIGFGGQCFKQFDAYVYTNIVDQTTRVVQVVFVSRNVLDANFSSRVRFMPDGFFGNLNEDDGRTVVVELGSVSHDIVSGEPTTNKVYLVDHSAFTNAVLYRNLVDGTRRPSTMEIRRNAPFTFDDPFFFTNATFTPDLLYNPSYASNAVDVSYAAYRVFLNSTGSTNIFNVGVHPTNFTGRVEIIGDNVDLTQTRVKAETTAIIKAKNLVANNLASVDAPFLSYDLGAVGRPLVIQNIAPSAVHRMGGFVSAWSSTWENQEVDGVTTNLIRFHVLVVDNDLQSLQPVTITDLALRAPTVDITDSLNVRDIFRLDAQGFRLGGSLTFPFGTRWGSPSVSNLVNFTNDGSIFIQGSALYGTERAGGYDNFINRGTNIASSQSIRAGNFENPGCIIATSGALTISARDATILGGPSSVSTNLVTNAIVTSGGVFTNVFFAVITNIPGKIQGSSAVELSANDLYASNSFILAGASGRGSATLNITNSLRDGGVGSSNRWTATAGFKLSRRPNAGGDLLGTHITTLAGGNQAVFNTWPAVDRGSVVGGFDNNLAVAKLTIDAATNAIQGFGPPAGFSGGAIYVDYLELLNYATNYVGTNSPLSIAPGFTIYFANANIPPSKLDDALGLEWVTNYVGPLSGTNIVYPTPPYPPGTVVRANIALATSKDIDSDGDGIVNGNDPDPFFIDQSVGLRIEASKSGDALLSWNALSKATNILECANSMVPNSWVTVTNFVQGEQTTRVRVRESLSQTNQRIYRVRVTSPQ